MGGGGNNGFQLWVVITFPKILIHIEFKCPMCSAQASYVGFQQSEFAAALNKQWIRHMEHKLGIWGNNLFLCVSFFFRKSLGITKNLN